MNTVLSSFCSIGLSQTQMHVEVKQQARNYAEFLSALILFASIVFVAGKSTSFSATCDPTLARPFPDSPITSDFGPRVPPIKPDGTKGSFFHKGIDIGASFGASIPAVESGTITAIQFEPGFGWRIEIRGSKGVWWYAHTFKGDQNGPFPIEVGGFKLDRKPSGEYFIERPDGSKLNIKDPVQTGEIIAPVGTSGGVAAHLHLALNGGADSPFCYVKHPESNFTVQIEFSPPSLPESCPPQTCGFAPIAALVDSTTGLDLDKVKIFIDGSPVEFRFGGRPNEGASNNALKDGDSGEEKVEPQDADRAQAGVQPGLDKFLLPPKEFCAGKHTIEVKAYNVLNPDKEVAKAKLEFELKEPRPQLCNGEPWNPEEPIEFASQKEGCFALGFASIHDFPYCMYEETAMNVGPTCSAGLFCCPEVRALAEAVSRPLVWDVPRCFADGLDSEWSPVVKKYAALWWKYHKWRYVINLQPDCTNCPNSHLGNFPHDHVRKTATLEMALYKPSTETHEELATITGSVISSGGKITKIEYRVDKSSYWIAAIPVDGALDSGNEPFFFKLPNEIFVV